MSENISKEKRIKKELSKLKKVFANLPENQKKTTEKLIENAAYSAICLEDLREKIDADGYEETYQNGANQGGKKQSVAMSTYLSLLKDYTTIITGLLKYIPAEDRKKSKMAAFLNDK